MTIACLRRGPSPPPLGQGSVSVPTSLRSQACPETVLGRQLQIALVSRWIWTFASAEMAELGSETALPVLHTTPLPDVGFA
jgi:hypothetical protein